MGFVYNSGERVLSTTTPLFAILLALLGTIWPDLPHLANLIGAFSLALGGVFLWNLGQSWDAPAVSWAGVLLYPTFPLLLSTLGSETPLYLALCLGAFAFYARRNYSATAFFAALAVLTRADGVLVPFLLALDYLWREWSEHRSFPNIPWRALLWFFLLLIPWHLYSWAYFGSPFPATLAAKQQQGLMSISTLFAPGFLRVAGWYRFGWQYWVEAGLALIGVVWAIWRRRHWVTFLAWPLLYFTAYTYLGVTSYPWYYAPLVPGFFVAVGLGVSGIRNQGLGTRNQELGSERWFSVLRPPSSVLTGLLLAALTFTQVSALTRMRQSPDARYPIYRAVGEWLDVNTPPDAQVGMLEVGIIGFYSHRFVIGFAGLLQPAVAEQLQLDTTYEDAALWAVDAYSPEYLVLHAGAFPRLEQGYAASYCRMAQKFIGAEFGYSSDMQIYICER